MVGLDIFDPILDASVSSYFSVRHTPSTNPHLFLETVGNGDICLVQIVLRIEDKNKFVFKVYLQMGYCIFFKLIFLCARLK